MISEINGSITKNGDLQTAGVLAGLEHWGEARNLDTRRAKEAGLGRESRDGVV